MPLANLQSYFPTLCDKLTAWVEQRAKQGGDTLLITQFDRKAD